jgi:hypothetical protein
LNLVEELEEKLESLRNAVNSLLDHLPWYVPGWVTDKIRGKWNELCADWQASLEDWKADLAAVGEAWTLRGAADQWSTDVGEKVSGLPGKIAVGPLHSDEIFSGASADAYKGIIPGQGLAITNITANLTSALSKGLDDTADAINDYNAKMIVAVIALAVAVASAIAAVVTSETGVGAVIGLIACIGAIAVFAGAVYSAETGIDNAAEGVQSIWNTAIGNWAGYDGQKWPQATFAS